MKISVVNFNFRNSKNINKTPFQNKNKNTQENISFQGANHLSNLNSLFLASNISFGNNVKIIEQMKKEKNIEKRKELFNDLTQKAQDNVNGVIEHEKLKDENGEPILTFKEYLRACAKKATLFTQTPDTIVNNVVGVVEHEKLKDENGEPILTLKEYLNVCVKKATLFTQAPDTIVNNVVGVVEHEKLKDENGEPILTLKEYLHACVRQPSLFHQSPDTIADHIKALLFINKDRLYFKTGEIDKNTLVKNTLRATLFIACTNDLNYSFLLREKMFLSHNPKGVGGNEKVRAKLKQYLQNNPNEKFTFSIIKDEKSDEFIEFAKKFAKEATGRDDVFNIHCVEMV